MAIRIDQQSKFLGEEWWHWSVELNGPPEELNKVDHVIYTLHETFPNPVRRVIDRISNFRLDAEGWGEFTIYATVVFKDGREDHLRHDLALHYPDGGRTTA